MVNAILIAVWLLALGKEAPANQAYPFASYPVSEIFHGTPAQPQLSTPYFRQYQTRIREGAKRGPNFAGHYTFVEWGCGAECGTFVIVDTLSGRIYRLDQNISYCCIDEAGMHYRVDSTLVVIVLCPSSPPNQECVRKFYNWDGSRLVFQKSEPVTAATP